MHQSTQLTSLSAMAASFYQIIQFKTRLEVITLVMSRMPKRRDREAFLFELDRLSDLEVKIASARQLALHAPTLVDTRIEIPADQRMTQVRQPIAMPPVLDSEYEVSVNAAPTIVMRAVVPGAGSYSHIYVNQNQKG